jgi:chorismate mutase/prephenate dehydratase
LSDFARRIQTLRDEIDAIDDKILELLGERAQRNAEVGALKSESSETVYVPSRELEIFERLERKNSGLFPTHAIRNVFREILSACRSIQKGVRVAYLGPQGTYTHQAAIQQFGRTGEFSPAVTIADIFAEVEAGNSEYGVVPVENSTEGVVSNTLDLLVDSRLSISAEIHMPIRHELLSRSGRMQDIKQIYSHPQGLAQCRQWLEMNLPGVAQGSAGSTAQAAERASRDPAAAAIAGAVAAQLYDLQIVASGIEDYKGNTTRFLVLSTKAPARSSRDITSILFSTRRDEAGTLYRALEPFALNHVSLTRIESRPTKVRAWEYVFFCDFEGHVEDKPVAAAIEALVQRCDFVKVLGSYPRAAAVNA